jgi:cell division protein FtsW (lipid II flippase)
MKINELFYRRVLLVCAVLFVIVGLVIALGVIPPVKADPYPGVKHDMAAAAFWVNIGFNLLSAFILFFISFRSTKRNWKSTSVLTITGILVLLLGLALADAASAYQNHGPSMQTASILLFICAAVDSLGGLTVIITTFLRPKTV